MSNDGADRTGTRRAVDRHLPTLAKPVRVASFWLAIVLPFLYVPLLLNGLSTLGQTLTFFGLLVVNVALLYTGHAHRQ